MMNKPKRRALSAKTRFEVFKRDGFSCQYCGAHPPGVLLHVDHVIAVAAGGTNAIDNLVTACQPCNLGKGARDLRVAPQSLADKAKETADREAQLLGYQAILEAKRQRLDAETWRVMEVLHGNKVSTFPGDEFRGVRNFIEKLGVHAVVEAAEITIDTDNVAYQNRFRYFCGVCWNRVRKAQQ